MNPSSMTPFESFFVECILICVNEFIAPDDYFFDLRNPGVWLNKFNFGMTPRDAVNSVFRAN